MRVMRRLVVVALFVVATIGVGASPASAHSVDFCMGNGTMVTSSNLYYVGFGPSAAFSGNMTLVIGGCVLGHSGSAGLNMVGNCGLATGAINWGGHVGTAVWSGDTIEFDGQVEGSLTITEDRLAGESCTSGADQFLVGGAVFLH